MTFPKHVRIGIVPTIDIFVINKSETGQIEVVGGMEHELLSILSRALRFQFTLSVPEDLEWGRKTSNGTWTGLVGMVKNGEADMAISKIGLTWERASAVDFAYPYNIEDLTFATRPPGLLPEGLALLQPFTLSVWVSLLVTVLAVAVAFQGISRTRNPGFRANLLSTFGSLLSQPKRTESRCRLPERLLLGSWLVGAMVLANSYRAVLLSFLTVPGREDIVETKQQLSEALDAGTYRCTTIEGSSMLSTLQYSADHHDRNIGRHIQFVIPPKTEVFIQLLGERNIAIVAPKNDFYAVPKNKIFLSKDSFSLMMWSVAVGKDFCCKDALDSMVHRITAAGLHRRSVEQTFARAQLKARLGESGNQEAAYALNFGEVSGALMILVAGYTLSLLALACEILGDKLRQRPEKACPGTRLL